MHADHLIISDSELVTKQQASALNINQMSSFKQASCNKTAGPRFHIDVLPALSYTDIVDNHREDIIRFWSVMKIKLMW